MLEEISMANIDVNRDLIHLDFLLKSDINVDEIGYTLELTKWTDRNI